MAKTIEPREIAYEPKWPLQFQAQTPAEPADMDLSFRINGLIWSVGCFVMTDGADHDTEEETADRR